MKIGINLAAIEWGWRFENLPGIFSDLETKEVEFPVQLWQQSGCPTEILASLNVCNVSGLLHRTKIFPESIFTNQKIFEEQIAQVDSKLEAVKALGCSAMSLGIDPWVSLELDKAEQIFLERVSSLASILVKHSITLNLEYISHKIVLPDDQVVSNMFCPSLKKAISLIETLNNGSVKLLLDVIHWFADGMSLKPKEILDMIGFVHLCDYPHQDVNLFTDMNRVLPFEGQLPLDKFLFSLQKGGYEGCATIEVFRTESYQPTFFQMKKAVSKCREKTHAFV